MFLLMHFALMGSMSDMPALENARHERFAQELAKGASQTDAYLAAGYKGDKTAASRLSTNVNVQQRIAELKAKAAERTIITIHDIADQLDEDRTFARELENPSAAISATMGKAKVLGLLTERHEHTGKDGKDLVPERSDIELARLIAFHLTKASQD
jgi:phage terminase small subunit